jgi:hypothetical protein
MMDFGKTLNPFSNIITVQHRERRKKQQQMPCKIKCLPSFKSMSSRKREREKERRRGERERESIRIIIWLRAKDI